MAVLVLSTRALLFPTLGLSVLLLLPLLLSSPSGSSVMAAPSYVIGPDGNIVLNVTVDFIPPYLKANNSTLAPFRAQVDPSQLETVTTPKVTTSKPGAQVTEGAGEGTGQGGDGGGWSAWAIVFLVLAIIIIGGAGFVVCCFVCVTCLPFCLMEAA